jgi:hypothetical protein
VDWDNDGLNDILAGNMIGEVYIFLNTTDNTNPAMDNGAEILSGGASINAGRAATEINDWNEDGKKDMIIGSVQGHVRIYINEGTDAAPVFNSFTNVQVGGSDFDIGSRASPRVFDWTRDGLKDLLVGEIGGTVHLLENEGTNAAPVFNSSNQITLLSGNPLNNGDYSRLYIIDWNNDGQYDLLVGMSNGKIMFYEGAS